MRFGKLCLSGLGVVEAEQSHPQIIVCMGKCRVEAHSLAVTDGGILKFPCVEQCSAEVEPHIRIMRFQRNQFFVGGNGTFPFVSGQLARAEPDERVRKVWLLREGFFVIGSRLGVFLLRVVRITQIVCRIELVGLKRETVLIRLDRIAEFALIGLRLPEREQDLRLVMFEGQAFLEGGGGLVVAFGSISIMPPYSRNSPG